MDSGKRVLQSLIILEMISSFLRRKTTGSCHTGKDNLWEETGRAVQKTRTAVRDKDWDKCIKWVEKEPSVGISNCCQLKHQLGLRMAFLEQVVLKIFKTIISCVEKRVLITVQEGRFGSQKPWLPGSPPMPKNPSYVDIGELVPNLFFPLRKENFSH